ncbi:hypothetical protein R9X47_25765 [Wukongibacter baidiensis]|uniref:hypothetical protein n=1 Tax=Wukongibacter baidiensis TaxID=1723361 RepID=UPI003D7FDEB8
MKERKKAIEEVFYHLITYSTSIEEFEKWIYEQSDIEEIYGYDFYFNLLWLDYKSKYIREDLEKIIFEKIPFDFFEKRRILRNLYKLKNGEKGLKEIMSVFYEDYCNGYVFLRILGLAYLLYGIDEHDEEYFRTPSKVDIEKINVMIEKLEDEADRIIRFLESEEIKIVSKNEYEDFRKDEDKIEEKYFS